MSAAEAGLSRAGDSAAGASEFIVAFASSEFLLVRLLSFEAYMDASFC